MWVDGQVGQRAPTYGPMNTMHLRVISPYDRTAREGDLFQDL